MSNRHDLTRDIEQLRDELKDLFSRLQDRHPGVKFSAQVIGQYTETQGIEVANFDVRVTTTHCD